MKILYSVPMAMAGLLICNTHIYASHSEKVDSNAQFVQAIIDGDADTVKTLWGKSFIKNANYVAQQVDPFTKTLCAPLKATLQALEQERQPGQTATGTRVTICEFLLQKGAMVDGVALRIIKQHEDLQKTWSACSHNAEFAKFNMNSSRDIYTTHTFADLVKSKTTKHLMVTVKDDGLQFCCAEAYAKKYAHDLEKTKAEVFSSVVLYEYTQEGTDKEFPFALVEKDSEGILTMLKEFAHLEQPPEQVISELNDDSIV